MTDTKETNDILDKVQAAEGTDKDSVETAMLAESDSELWSEDQLKTSDVSEGIEEAFLALIQSEDDAVLNQTTSSSEPLQNDSMAQSFQQSNIQPDTVGTQEALETSFNTKEAEAALENNFTELTQEIETTIQDDLVTEAESLQSELTELEGHEQSVGQITEMANEELQNIKPAAHNIQAQAPQQPHENNYNSEFLESALSGDTSHVHGANVPQDQLKQSISNLSSQHTQTQPVEFESQQIDASSHLPRGYGMDNMSQPETQGFSMDDNALKQSSSMANQNQIQKANVDPEFQALVQWSNSDVERAHHGHGGPHDIPNFLAQKKVEESKFSFKTVFVTLGISSVVLSMLFIGYQAGRMGSLDNRNGVYDATADNQLEKEIVVEKKEDTASRMFSETTSNTNNNQQRIVANVKPEAAILKFSVSNLSGTSGKVLPMDIELEGNNLGLETILLLRGIPDQLSLSTGSKREGVWSVPMGDLKKLALVVPNDYQGKFDFEVFAFKDKQSGPERRVATVSIDGLPVQQNIQASQSQESFKVASIPEVRQKPETQKPLDTETKPVTEVQQVQQPVRQQQTSRPQISKSVETTMLRRGNRLLRDG